MSHRQLIQHFLAIAQMLLTHHRAAIGDANVKWLLRRLELGDFGDTPGDFARLREMMPAVALWLLHTDPDDE
jgi:hypothetical protein